MYELRHPGAEAEEKRKAPASDRCSWTQEVQMGPSLYELRHLMHQAEEKRARTNLTHKQTRQSGHSAVQNAVGTRQPGHSAVQNAVGTR